MERANQARDGMSSVSSREIPAITADQMRAVDRLMVEEMHIDLIQMMENAGARLAELAMSQFSPGSVTILAGPGGNGGGGLVAARHLSNRGVRVGVALSSPPDRLTPVPGHQLDILQRMQIPVSHDPSPADLIIDALIGYSLHGSPHGSTAGLIDWTNRQEAPTLALDNPSGLDVTTGRAAAPTIRAAATLTLALPKVGLLLVPEYVGHLYLADISVPAVVYQRLGVAVPDLFQEGTIVEVHGNGDTIIPPKPANDDSGRTSEL